MAFVCRRTSKALIVFNDSELFIYYLQHRLDDMVPSATTKHHSERRRRRQSEWPCSLQLYIFYVQNI